MTFNLWRFKKKRIKNRNEKVLCSDKWFLEHHQVVFTQWNVVLTGRISIFYFGFDEIRNKKSLVVWYFRVDLSLLKRNVTFLINIILHFIENDEEKWRSPILFMSSLEIKTNSVDQHDLSMKCSSDKWTNDEKFFFFINVPRAEMTLLYGERFKANFLSSMDKTSSKENWIKEKLFLYYWTCKSCQEFYNSSSHFQLKCWRFSCRSCVWHRTLFSASHGF